MTTPKTALLTVYFDGACPICRREIAVYRAQPGADRLHWVDVAAPDYSVNAAATPGPALAPQAALARLHVREPNGQLLSGAAAFNAMWLALPRWRWLGLLTASRPVLGLLEVAYRIFLKLRPLWRKPAAVAACTDDQCGVSVLSADAQPDAQRLDQHTLDQHPLDSHTLDSHTLADLRSDHAGETGAIWIYKGILTVSRDVDLRRFAEDHLGTEQRHLALIDTWLPAAQHSQLLPIWRVAGFITGAAPALFGRAAVYRTIAAVETFVDHHYQEQIDRIDGLLAQSASGHARALEDLRALRDLLESCRQDECHHRDDAAGRLSSPAGWTGRIWQALVGRGSAAAVVVCRRI